MKTPRELTSENALLNNSAPNSRRGNTKAKIHNKILSCSIFVHFFSPFHCLWRSLPFYLATCNFQATQRDPQVVAVIMGCSAELPDTLRERSAGASSVVRLVSEVCRSVQSSPSSRCLFFFLFSGYKGRELTPSTTEPDIVLTVSDELMKRNGLLKSYMRHSERILVADSPHIALERPL